MFGSLRFYLAVLVVLTHILGLSYIGQFAVFGFYTLSGYLMTLIMKESYQYSPLGFMSFWKNRALRLLPTYWVASILALGIIVWIGVENISQYNPRMGIPNDISSWFQNVFIVFVSLNPFEVAPRLTTVSWAITVEIFFYALISLGLARSLKTVIPWVILSIAYHIFSFSFDLHYNSRYMPLAAASLPFSIGALIYHIKSKPIKFLENLRGQHWLLIFLLCLSFIPFQILVQGNRAQLVSPEIFSSILDVVFYITYLIIALSIYSMATMASFKSFIPKKLDKLLGDLSYPLYLFHLQIAYFVSYVIYERPIKGLHEEGIVVFTVTMVASIIIGLVVLKFIEQPIDRVRLRIKTKASNSQ